MRKPSPAAESALIERVWRREGRAGAVAHAGLAPLSALWSGAAGLRNWLYDTGVFRAHPTAIPLISIGNVSVGGTGKTPFAAWTARQLRERGGSPAVVLRGYGADEPLVHAVLSPDIPVVTGRDRVSGAVRAGALGADVGVLDDGFQHRRARRVADLVLVSADAWPAGQRTLPAGPMRESLVGLRRASLVIVTRKAVPQRMAVQVADALVARTGIASPAIVHLSLDELRTLGDGSYRSLQAAAGAAVYAIASVGDPRAFLGQLADVGADVTADVFPDHHDFSARETTELARRAASADIVVCTLKDAVKLAPRWPRAGPALWYVSQRVTVERGAEDIDRQLDSVLRARAPSPPAAGAGRPTDPVHGY